MRPGGLSVSYPADRRLQDQLLAVTLHYPHGPFSILSCGSSVASVRRGGPGRHGELLSVSYPADRRLQAARPTTTPTSRPSFQYPILRIVGCKSGDCTKGPRGMALSVSYPADRRLQDEPSKVGEEAVNVHFQYPILRIVGCKAHDHRLAPPLESPFSILSCGSSVASSSLAACIRFASTSFSILSCGSSVARRSYGVGVDNGEILSVSYPADRRLQAPSVERYTWPVGYLSVSYPADRRLQGRAKHTASTWMPSFSILSCGSSVARPPRWLPSPVSQSSFSILSCGSSVARCQKRPKAASA